MPQKPTTGRIVNYVMPEGTRAKGQIRPAIVVTNWSPDSDAPALNLHVFVDPANDIPLKGGDQCSVTYSEGKEPRTWHWPPRV